MWRNRADTNHVYITGTFEAMGCSVLDVHLAPGGVDLVVAKHGITALVEIKRPGQKLKKHQAQLRDTWKGLHATVRDLDDVTALVGQLREQGAAIKRSAQ